MLTSDNVMYLSFTGRTTGFSYFKNEELVQIERMELEELCEQYGFNKKFKIEYICVQEIPMGKLIIENLFLTSCKKLVNL